MNEPTAIEPPGADAAVDPPRYRLRLYVSGATPRSRLAIENIKSIGEKRLAGRYELEVIDAYQQAELARDEHIIVLPTLIKFLPVPLRRMVGDLSDTEQVLLGLGLIPEGATHMTIRTMPDARTNDCSKVAVRETIAELQSQLTESQETLRAIRAGEADAITVTTPAGELVYSLKGAEQPYRDMIEALSAGAVSVSPDGMVLYCNQRFADLAKTDLRTVMGSNLQEYFAGQDRTRIIIALREYGITRVRAQMLGVDGTLVPVDIAMYRQSDTGSRSFVIIAISDLTEIVAAQEAIARANQHLEDLVAARTGDLEHANQALNSANKELETFAFSVSHDLRAPLRAIDGFSHVLQEDYAETVDAEGQRLIQVIRDGVGRMARLIDDILDFSRASRREMAASDIDMTALVHATLSVLEPAMTGRNIKMKVEPLPPMRGDREMMQRVWMNLLDNAIKFAARTENAWIEVGSYPEARNNVYFVKDNGAGFDMAYVDKLFGVFQRLHSAEDFPGTGAGLAIVKRIVNRHGGRVWAEGKVGEGATFYFALPSKMPDHV